MRRQIEPPRHFPRAAVLNRPQQKQRRKSEPDHHLKSPETDWLLTVGTWAGRCYFRLARLVRIATDRTIGIRPGVIVLAATVAGAVAVMVTQSAISTAIVSTTAILVSSALLYLPSDRTLKEANRSINEVNRSFRKQF